MFNTPLDLVRQELIPDTSVQALHTHDAEQVSVVASPRRRGDDAAAATAEELGCARATTVRIDGAGGFNAEGPCRVGRERGAVQPAEVALTGARSQLGRCLLRAKTDLDPAAVAAAVVLDWFRRRTFLCRRWAVAQVTPWCRNAYYHTAVYRVHRPCPESGFNRSAGGRNLGCQGTSPSKHLVYGSTVWLMGPEGN